MVSTLHQPIGRVFTPAVKREIRTLSLNSLIGFVWDLLGNNVTPNDRQAVVALIAAARPEVQPDAQPVRQVRQLYARLLCRHLRDRARAKLASVD